MTATETILFTALPNGVDRHWGPGGALNLSVFISPRLARIPPPPDGEPSLLPLRQFRHFRTWPQVARKIEWEVLFHTPGAELLKLPAQIVSPPPRPQLWELFKDALVRDYQFADYSQYTIHSYPAATIWGMLEEGYRAAAYFNDRLNIPHLEGRLSPEERAKADFFRDMLSDLANSARRGGPRSVWQEVSQRLDEALASQKAVAPGLYGDGWDTPHKRLSALLQFERFYYRSSEQHPVEPLEVELDRPDFHQMVAALAEYPLLLRWLGLAVDLRVPYHAKIPTGDANATVAARPGAPSPWVQPAPTRHVLQTRYTLDGNGPAGFRACEAGSDLRHRRMQLGTLSLYSLIEVDAEGAAFKAQSLGVTVVFDPEHLQTTSPIDLPALRAGGLSVVRSGRAVQVHNILQAAQQRNQALQSTDQPVVLSAPDVQRGYRIDVWDERAGRWFSLCQRTGEYELAGSTLQTRDLLAKPATGYEEGIVSTAAAKSEEEQALYLQEALFHWDGWSLCAPRPGRSIGDEGQLLDSSTQAAETAAGPEWLRKNVKARFTVLPGSLPRLRFGHSYRLRARSVDLAGNSLPFDPDSPVNASSDAGPVTYLRFEPIRPPVAVTSTNARRMWNGEHIELQKYSDLRQSPGESLDRLVVRQPPRVRDPDAPPVDPDWCQRRIAPPECSQLFAEQHGMFDKIRGQGIDSVSRLDIGAYGAIVQREGAFLDPQPIDEQENTYSPHIFQMPYLADPLAQAVLFFDLPGTLTSEPIEEAPGAGAHWISVQLGDGRYRNILHIDFLPGARRWPDAQPLRLMLKGCAANTVELPDWNASRRILTVKLPAGESYQISACCVPTDSAKLKWLAAWQWQKENYPDLSDAQLQEQMLRGELLMLTPPRRMQLVHATRTPVEEPAFNTQFTQGDFRKYNLGDTSVQLKGGVRVHAASTAKVDIVARWSEPCERKEGNLIVAVEAVESQAQVAEMTVEAPEYPIPGDVESNRSTVVLGDIVHEFGDTRHRKVDYYAIAATRYQEYFDFLAEDENGGPPNCDTPPISSNPYVPVTKNILNSARPPAAPLLYVMPAFGWQENRQEDLVTRTRRAGGLRVFLEPPWFVTGEDEFLGVVTAQEDLNMMGEHTYDVMSKLVTTLSNDPTRYPYKFLDQFSFPLEKLPGDALCKDLCPAELSNPDNPGHAPHLCKVSVAAHAVQFDKNRQCYFADIEIDPAGAYFPFVRLALVRFQPYSLPGAQLSPVTLADFVQLTPERWLTLQYLTTNKKKMRLTVGGKPSPSAEDLKKTHIMVGVTRSLAMHPDNQDPLMWKMVPAGDKAGQVKFTPVPPPPAPPPGSQIYWCGDITLPEPPTANYPYRLVALETELHLSAQRTGIPWGDAAFSFLTGDEQIDALLEKGLKPRKRVVYADSVLLGP